MLGMQLAEREARPIVAAALDRGLIIGAAGSNVLRFLPPLTITTAEIDEGMELLAAALQQA